MTRTSMLPRLRPLVLAWAIAVALVLATPATTAAEEPLGPAAAPGGSSGAPASESAVRVYTNADLEALGPLPKQDAPLVESPGWDFVFEVLDRERDIEERRKDRDLAAASLSASAVPYEEPLSMQYVLPYHVWPPGCLPGPQAPTFVGPSNSFASLQVRGVHTAVDLFRESVNDSRIRRSLLP